MTVSKSTLRADIFKEFYNLINFYVTDPNSRSKWVFGGYPDYILDSASIRDSDYPTVVVNNPGVSWSKLTLKKNWVEFTIDVELFSTSAQEACETSDDIIDAIETHKVSLADSGVQLVSLDSVDDDMFMRGEAKVHHVTITFSGRFAFLKTPGY